MFAVSDDLNNYELSFHGICSPSRNSNLPRQLQLTEDDFRVTSFTYDEIEAKTEAKLRRIRQSKEVTAEEGKAAMDKIRKRFFDALVAPR